MPTDPYLRLSDLSRVVHREIVILVVLAAAASGLFIVTRAAASGNREQQLVDAAAWYERGQGYLATHDTRQAVAALRRAVARRPDEWTYARTLAEALVQDGRTDSARQLLSLWRTRQPDDADVNMRLARLEAAAGDVASATDYYEDALHGRWPADAASARVDLRRELIQLLLATGNTGAALSHILTLAANLPDDVAAQSQVADLFLEARDPARALEHYQRALRLAPTDPAARAGAAAAAFGLSDYTRALAYARNLTDERSRRIAAVSSAVAASDPLIPRLSGAERERRLGAAIDVAADQLDACRKRSRARTPLAERSAAAVADALADFDRTLTPRRVRESPEVLDRGLELVASALSVVAAQCAPLDVKAEALQRVARRHGSAE
ncbi:MAG: tetratricopeptide repeat protein [Vicinamibacterales bacterium]